jgi:hypothetical protein
MGLFWIWASGLPGNRVEAQRAGIMATALGSVGMPVDESIPEGSNQNFDIKKPGPLLDVIQIVLDPFFQVGNDAGKQK